ncbi:MAG: hypothetical protein ACR2P5_04675 [Gammaproteobacteria bacterium]
MNDFEIITYALRHSGVASHDIAMALEVVADLMDDLKKKQAAEIAAAVRDDEIPF